MGDIKIFRSDEIRSDPLPGAEEDAGSMKRIIYPPRVMTKGVFMGRTELGPGWPGRWHTHTRGKAEGYEVVYPEDFEEIYHIISGSGSMQWRREDGKIEEEKVGPGDTIFFPVGAPEHRLSNNGTEKLVLILCGSPTPKVTLTK